MQNTYPLEIDRCEFNCRLPSLAATSLNFSMLYRGNSSGENTGVGEVGDHGKEWLWVVDWDSTPLSKRIRKS